MPNSGQEGEFKNPVGFVDTSQLYPAPQAPNKGSSPDQPVDTVRYIEHQFDESNPPS